MDWTQVFTIIGANVVLFFWLRTESSADRRQMQQEAAADRRDLLQIIREIKEEAKDFHGRLERNDAEFKAHLMHLHEKKQ
jgi:galactokinase/mevalonate kinase-like predicted kinase